ncbi:MAG TPA: nuclear transport factor 2 family protein [Trebonia sp.]|nr:nuclear transport factor 2 family protein [Trebonia sp.]
MSTESVAYADVVAGVRAALARYAHAVDDGRPDDVVATFCPDGSADIPGAGVVTGTEALVAYFAALEPRGRSRHVVVNTLVTKWDAGQATAISDLIVLGRAREAGWSVHLVGRYHDVLHNGDGTWRFHSRTLRFAD